MTVKELIAILGREPSNADRTVWVRVQYRDGTIDMALPLEGMDKKGKDNRARGNQVYLFGVCDE